MYEKCRICGNEGGNEMFYVKERMINDGTVFCYMKCGQCGALQLADEIENMGDWYPESYNQWSALSTKKLGAVRTLVRYAFMSAIMAFPVKGLLLERLRETHNNIMILNGIRLKRTDAILDVGCGNGRWLYDLSLYGFKNLTGVDSLAPNNEENIGNIKLIRGDIFHPSLKNYDLIAYNYSFEHMNNPLETLRRTRDLLKSNGIAVFRIPVMGGHGWKAYGTNWFGIEAPRHYFLHTVESMRILCEKAGLTIDKTIHDSKPFHYLMSDQYKSSKLSYGELRRNVSSQDIKTRWKEIHELNRLGKGDYMAFYIKKA